MGEITGGSTKAKKRSRGQRGFLGSRFIRAARDREANNPLMIPNITAPEAAPRYARHLRGRYPTEGGLGTGNPPSVISLQRAGKTRVS